MVLWNLGLCKAWRCVQRGPNDPPLGTQRRSLLEMLGRLGNSFNLLKLLPAPRKKPLPSVEKGPCYGLSGFSGSPGTSALP